MVCVSLPQIPTNIIARRLIHYLAILLAPLTSCLPDRPEIADRYAVSGIDVSHYQGIIDWDALAREGHDFVFIKATEGRDLKDTAFATNWKLAGDAGMRRGAYHFFRPEVSAEAQARNFFGSVNLQTGDLPPVIDVEDRGKLSATALVKRIMTLSETMRVRYGVRPIIYTGQNFYNRFLAGQFDDHPLWLARYDTTEPVTVCGRDFDFWQYTDRGRLAGINGNVDRNVFTGSRLELEMLCLQPLPHGDAVNLAKGLSGK